MLSPRAAQLRYPGALANSVILRTITRGVDIHHRTSREPAAGVGQRNQRSAARNGKPATAKSRGNRTALRGAVRWLGAGSYGGLQLGATFCRRHLDGPRVHRATPARFTSQCEYVVWGTNGPREFSTVDATYHPGILRHPAPSGNRRKHSTQKPVEILTELVQVAAEGETVLDAFMGSGSTGVACDRIHETIALVQPANVA